MHHKKPLSGAIKFFIAMVALVASIECLLRFGLGLGNPVLITPDSACNYTLKPNQDIFRFFARTFINSYGMRSEEVPANRVPHSLRLIFVGDSITYGTSRVDQSSIFTEILRRDLPSITHEPVEVLNASASAWAIDNELSFVRSRGIFQSDIVLLVLNSGDLAQQRSIMAQVGDDVPQKRESTAIGELCTRYIEPRIPGLRLHVDAGDSASDHPGNIERANLTDLDAFRALVTSQHARMVLVYVPFRKDVPNSSAASASVLHAWAATHQVPLLDLTSAESPYPAREITLDDGVHFNEKGHRLVADAIEHAWPALGQP